MKLHIHGRGIANKYKFLMRISTSQFYKTMDYHPRP